MWSSYRAHVYDIADTFSNKKYSNNASNVITEKSPCHHIHVCVLCGGFVMPHHTSLYGASGEIIKGVHCLIIYAAQEMLHIQSNYICWHLPDCRWKRIRQFHYIPLQKEYWIFLLYWSEKTHHYISWYVHNVLLEINENAGLYIYIIYIYIQDFEG